MNYRNTKTIINERGLNTNGTLGDSHFADTSYPSVSLTKGGTMSKTRHKTMGKLKTKKDYLIDDIFENQMRNWFKYFPSCGQSYRIVDGGKKVIITISNIRAISYCGRRKIKEKVDSMKYAKEVE